MFEGWPIIIPSFVIWAYAFAYPNIKQFYDKPKKGTELSNLIFKDFFYGVGLLTVINELVLRDKTSMYSDNFLAAIYVTAVIAAICSLCVNQLGNNKLTKLSHS